MHPMAIVLGAGLTQVTVSPSLAAGIFPINTVALPMAIGPPTCGLGGDGGGMGSCMGQLCMSPTLAAGMPPISTVGQPGPVMVPPCAVESPTLAAG